MRTSETIVVNPRPAEPAPSGFRIQDIYYVLFRHKWKIIFLTLIGMAAGAFVFLTFKPSYVSQAQVLVAFVESRGGAKEEGTSISRPDNRGDTIISSEMEMLKTVELARDVVSQVGATNIVDAPYDEKTESRAVAAVRGGIEVEAGKRSSVINVRYRNDDPEVVRLVLTNVIAAYQRMHARVHTAADVLADASRQVELRRNSLNKIEDDLRTQKKNLGIDSVEEARKGMDEKVNRLSSEILATEVSIAEQRALLGLSNVVSTPSATNTASAAPSTVVPTNTISAPKLAEYRRVLSQIDSLLQKENQFLESFTPEHTFVINTRRAIAEAEKRRQKLEEENPGIANYYSGTPSATTAQAASPTSPASNPVANAVLLLRQQEARLATLREQLSQVQTNAARITEGAAQIQELERRRAIEEQGYTYHYKVLDQARVDETLNRDKVRGLSVIEWATPPAADRGIATKLAAGLCAGGFLLGLGLAALLEFYVDGSVRRPIHVERNLRLPLFLSIPRLRQRKVAGGGTAPEGASTNLIEGPAAPGAVATVTTEGDESMATYAEALRDRLMMYFQLHGLNHKPKLVGVTSCGHGAGVTSLATSLAASLSETGDGNVLYVDVNQTRGAKVRGFQRGKQRIGLRDALENDTRETARVQDNLYAVTLADPATGKVGVIPKTLSGLVPKLKASDYDYIIFDLPPITQTSATAKVAGLLDMTFVVLESEKTLGDLARKATDLLGESRANVAAVLNKHRRYLPRRVDTDL